MSELPLCREADDSAPCRFSATCSESRQRLQHYAGLRGSACWAFAMKLEKLAPAEPGVLGETKT